MTKEQKELIECAKKIKKFCAESSYIDHCIKDCPFCNKDFKTNDFCKLSYEYNCWEAEGDIVLPKDWELEKNDRL